MFITHKIVLDKLVPGEITDHISEYVDINNARIDLEIALLHSKNELRAELLSCLNNQIYTINDLIREYNDFLSYQLDIKLPYPPNKLVMYRILYKNNGKFRKFMNSKIPEGLLENDPNIKAKKTIPQKLIAESIFTWNYIKQYSYGYFIEFSNLYTEHHRIIKLNAMKS